MDFPYHRQSLHVGVLNSCTGARLTCFNIGLRFTWSRGERGCCPVRQLRHQAVDIYGSYSSPIP